MQKNNDYIENDKPIKITGKNIILCEGKDAKLFILHFLGSTKYADFLDLKDGKRYIEIKDYGGNSELPTHLKTLKLLDGFDDVKSILIIRDAETDYKEALKDIKYALKENDFAVPSGSCEKVVSNDGIAIGFLLFPTCSKELKNGTLEDLCLKILSEDNVDKVKSVVDNYLDEMRKEGYTKLKKYHKSVLHSYLSAKDEYVTLKLGEAAKSGAFNFKSKELDSLLEFIGKMVESY